MYLYKKPINLGIIQFLNPIKLLVKVIIIIIIIIIRTITHVGSRIITTRTDDQVLLMVFIIRSLSIASFLAIEVLFLPHDSQNPGGIPDIHAENGLVDTAE